VKILGVIVAALASIGLLLFFVLVIPGDRRGEAACLTAMHERDVKAEPATAAHPPDHVAESAAHSACAEHQRHETPMRVLGMALFLTFIGGMFLYRRGTRA
jgi:hypothetical protein